MTVEIDSDVYADMLWQRYADYWDETDERDVLMDLLTNEIAAGNLEIKPDKMDPKTVVDNYLVNGSNVLRSDFREGNWYFDRYDGDWDAVCDAAQFCNDKAARLGF